MEDITLIIKIPKEFCKHYYTDRFEESLQRIKVDVKDSIYHRNNVSGNYEIETLDMIIDAFKNSKEVLYLSTDSIIAKY